MDGECDYGSVMAGQIAGLVSKRETCKEIIDDLVNGYNQVLRGIVND